MRIHRNGSAPIALGVCLALAGCSAASTGPAVRGVQGREITYGPRIDSAHVEVWDGANLDEYFSSTTREEWVAQADYVAAVRVASEEAVPAAAGEAEREEGPRFRTVALEVDSVVWAHPRAQQDAPKTLEFEAFGWTFDEEQEAETRFGLANAPYLLPGHRYLIALRYSILGCPGREDPADEPPFVGWIPLGSNAVVPYDDTLGSGEVAGVPDAGIVGSGLEEFRVEMTGRSTEWVSRQLTAAYERDPGLFHEDPYPSGCNAE